MLTRNTLLNSRTSTEKMRLGANAASAHLHSHASISPIEKGRPPLRILQRAGHLCDASFRSRTRRSCTNRLYCRAGLSQLDGFPTPGALGWPRCEHTALHEYILVVVRRQNIRG